MKTLLSFVRCLAFVLCVELSFLAIWAMFVAFANPYLIDAILNRGVPQSRVHLFAVDSLDFIHNYSLPFWWWVIALGFFAWTDRKPDKRTLFRRIGTLISLTIVFIAAAVIQRNA